MGGRVESRTHEILKSFLGSPHRQHMLLMSLVRSLFFTASAALPSLTIPPTRSVKVLPMLIQTPLWQSFMYSLIHSLENKNRSLSLKKNK